MHLCMVTGHVQLILLLNNKLQAAETVVLGMMFMRDPFFIGKHGKFEGIYPSPIYALSVHALDKKLKTEGVVR